MLHSEKARSNHNAQVQRLRAQAKRQFTTQTASDLITSGAPRAHVDHMIKKGLVINDIN